MPKYYAIRRPDGSWIMAVADSASEAWYPASEIDEGLEAFRGVRGTTKARKAGYRCCEVSGFVEVENG